MSKIDEIWIPLPLENPRETCIVKGTPKVIKNDVEKPSVWRSSKNQLFECHNDHYLDTSESLNIQRILYNKGSLKNVRLEEEKELGTCTAQGLDDLGCMKLGLVHTPWFTVTDRVPTTAPVFHK